MTKSCIEMKTENALYLYNIVIVMELRKFLIFELILVLSDRIGRG